MQLRLVVVSVRQLGSWGDCKIGLRASGEITPTAWMQWCVKEVMRVDADGRDVLTWA